MSIHHSSFVYALNDPVTGTCRYIGKANDPDARLKKHTDNSRLTRHLTPVEKWIKDLAEQGLAPTLEVVSGHTGEHEAFDAEMHEIAHRKNEGCPLLNVIKRGAPRNITAETRRKMSDAAKLRWQNPDWRAKFMATRSKRRLTPEHRAKLSAIRRGKPWNADRRAAFVQTEETRKKIGDAMRGRPWSPARRAAQERRQQFPSTTT